MYRYGTAALAGSATCCSGAGPDLSLGKITQLNSGREKHHEHIVQQQIVILRK